jgi:hypothetical protein
VKDEFRPVKFMSSRCVQAVSAEFEEAQAIHCDLPVANDPVEVWAGYPSCVSYPRNQLSCIYGVSLGNQLLVEMEIPGNETGAMVQIQNIPSKIEGIAEGDDPASWGENGGTHRSRKVCPHVAALDLPIEGTSMTEPAVIRSSRGCAIGADQSRGVR